MNISFVDKKNAENDIVDNKHGYTYIECSFVSLKVALSTVPYFLDSANKKGYFKFNFEVLKIFEEPAQTKACD